MKSKKKIIGIMVLVLGIIGLITWQLSSSIFDSANTRKQEPQTSSSSVDAGTKLVADNLSYWNSEEYQEYVEEQNQFLDKLVDSGEKYQENGKWYVWTKKKVDEAKQLNLDMLQQVKDGYLLEKTPEDAETQLIIYP